MEMIRTENIRYQMRNGEFGEWLDGLGIAGACEKMEQVNAFGIGDYTREKYEENDMLNFNTIERELGIV